MTDTALDLAVDFIAREEGFRSEPYLDVAGIPTIGYGFTYHADGSRVTMDDPPVSEEHARARLRELVSKTLAGVRVIAGDGLSDNQAAALTSFAFNLGTYALRQSSLLRRIQAGEDADRIREGFAMWVMAGGKRIQGLVNRRQREADLFLREG